MICSKVPAITHRFFTKYTVVSLTMETLNVRHEIRAFSLDASHAFDTVWHPAKLSKLSAFGIQGQLHTWLTDFLYSHSQLVALNGILSSPLRVKAGVLQGSFLHPHPIPSLQINNVSDSGKFSLSSC